MTRQLIPTIVLLAAGFSTEVLADTTTDISSESPVTESTADETADKSRKPASKKGSRAPTAGKNNSARPGKPATSTNPAKPRVTAQQANRAAPQAVKPTEARPGKPATSTNPAKPKVTAQQANRTTAQAAKPTSPANSSERQAAKNSSRNTTAAKTRPGSSSTSAARNKRPSTKKRPTTHNRPSSGNQARPNQSVQVKRHPYVPPRWTPSYHRYHLRGVPRHHPRYWSAGVFYYNPPPARHKVVVVHDGGQVAKGPEPTRALDRTNTFGVGLSSGSYNSGYKGGGGFGDMGIGLTATYRPVEAVGFELGWTHYDQSWDEATERIHETVQASVNIYAFPWTRVSPYATLGLTQTGRNIDDQWFDGYSQQTASTEQTVFGPHAGLGVEFAMGSAAALDFEGRYISYLDVKEGDPSAPSALQGTMGLKFYF